METVKRIFGSQSGINEGDVPTPRAPPSNQENLSEAESRRRQTKSTFAKPGENIRTPRGVQVTRHEDGTLTFRYPNGVVCIQRESGGEDRHGRYRRVETVKTFPSGYRTRNGEKLKTLTRVRYHYLEAGESRTETHQQMQRPPDNLQRSPARPDTTRRLPQGRAKPEPAGRLLPPKPNLKQMKEVIVCSRQS